VFDVDPQYQLLEFWKRAEGTFPIIAEMAREFLAIPASGVSVERLFNHARDICTYRRHSLKPETLRLLVMLMCMDSFNLKEEYRLTREANDLEDEWELISEDDDDLNNEDNISIYAISDKEEDFDFSEDDQYHPQDIDVFNLPDDIFGLPDKNIFGLQDKNIFGLQDNDDIYDLPDDLEAALQDSAAAQQSIPTAMITTSAPTVMITNPALIAVVSDAAITTVPSAQSQSQSTPIATDRVTRQHKTTLQDAPRRSGRHTRRS
jgi:hypothetical protein